MTERQPSLAEVDAALASMTTIYLALNNLKADLTVPGGPVDLAPIITEPVPVLMKAGQTQRVVITATDAEGPPTLELVGTYDWVDVVATPGMLALTLSPRLEAKGSFALDIKATDSAGLVDVASLKVDVAAPDAPPKAALPAGVMVTSVAGGLELSWEAAPEDVTQTFLSWGSAGGWLGNLKVPRGTATASLRGLAAVSHGVDVGFIRGSVWPTAAELVRVTATPIPSVLPPTGPVVPGTKPDAVNTGLRVVKEGLRLIEGRHAITSPGLVEGLRVIGQLFIDSPNVEVADCWVTGIYPGDGAIRNMNYKSVVHPGLHVHHCRIDGKDMREPAGYGIIGATHLHHNDISGCADSIKLGTIPGEIVEDNYCHHHAMGFSSVHGGPTHNDGMQAQAGRSGVIRRNSVIGPFADGGQGSGDPRTSANGGIFLKSDSGPVTDYDIYDNYVIGWGFCVYCYNNVSRTKVYNNILGSGPGFANFGPLQLVGSAGSGVQCYGNITQTAAIVANRN